MERIKNNPTFCSNFFSFLSCQTDAQDICRKKEGDLFSINSHEEFLSVFSFMGDSKKQYYSSFVFIGLKWDENVNSSKAPDLKNWWKNLKT